MKTFRYIAMAAVVAGVSLAGTSAGAQTKAPAKPAKKAAAPASTPYNKTLLTPAKLNAQAPETFDAKFTTTKGDFVIRVTREWSPAGADRFYNLVKNSYFDNASFFRVVPGFVVQFGLSAYPEVTAAWQKAPIQDEPVKGSNKPGFVTYAKGGANSRTTQVFINLSERNTRLDAMGFSPFGEVVEGMEVVEALYGGYGDSKSFGGNGPEQGRIGAEGKAYLDKEFPQLDSIKSAAIVGPAGAAPVKKAPPAKGMPSAKSTPPHK